MTTALAEINKVIAEVMTKPVAELEDEVRRMAVMATAQLIPTVLENAQNSDDPEHTRKALDTLKGVAVAYKPKDQIEALGTLNVQFIGGSFTATIQAPPSPEADVVDVEAAQVQETPLALEDSPTETVQVTQGLAERELEPQGADLEDPSFVDELNKMLGFD